MRYCIVLFVDRRIKAPKVLHFGASSVLDIHQSLLTHQNMAMNPKRPPKFQQRRAVVSRPGADQRTLSELRHEIRKNSHNDFGCCSDSKQSESSSLGRTGRSLTWFMVLVVVLVVGGQAVRGDLDVLGQHICHLAAGCSAASTVCRGRGGGRCGRGGGGGGGGGGSVDGPADPAIHAHASLLAG